MLASLFKKRHSAYAEQRALRVIANVEGGVYQRLDENRQLLALLDTGASDFLKAHPWVATWLESQDNFLDELSHSASGTAPIVPARTGFPRTYPVIKSLSPFSPSFLKLFFNHRIARSMQPPHTIQHLTGAKVTAAGLPSQN
jgi:hypothetical protein